ncbi:MAG: BACON domain-containing carbohydrate-binding protein [Vicinamibacterales bacterium]
MDGSGDGPDWELSRRGAWMSVALQVALVTWVPPAMAQPTTLVIHSRPGEYVGQGSDWAHTPADGPFVAERNSANGVEVRFQGPGSLWWRLDFAAPDNGPLVPGTYNLATRYPLQGPGEPGLDVSGSSRGCGSVAGRFTVFEVTYGTGTSVVSFAANFEQYCDAIVPGLFGSVRFNAAPRAAHTVAVGVSGAGTVTSFPAGISCGAACSMPVADGLISALIATPGSGSTFAGWSGPSDCADGVVTDAASVSCVATFATCTYSLAPVSTTGSPFGGSGQLAVTTAPGCPWAASRSDSWLSIDTSPHTGSQLLGYSYAPRGPYSSPRIVTISVASSTFTLTQSGHLPAFLVNPTMVQVGPEQGSALIILTANVVDAPWVASSNAGWLAVPTGGLGSASVPVAVTANPLPLPRTGTVVIAGSVVTIEQGPGGPPGIPARLTAAADGRAATFAWSPVPFDNAHSYRLDGGLSPGAAQFVTFPPRLPGVYQLFDVPPGRYFLRLRGINDYGTGPPTEDVEFVVAANGISPPAAPQNLAASLVNGVLHAQWQPSAVAGEVVDGYVLEAGASSDRTDIRVPMGLAQSLTVGNVPPGAYVLRVRAVNAAGDGTSTPEVLLVSGSGPAPAGAPGNLAAMITGSAVTLRWDAPATGGAPSTYRLEVGAYRGATLAFVEVQSPVTSVTFPGVPPGTYFVRVRGVNAVGLGLASGDVKVEVH